jgi:hypothetical protein
VGPNPALGSGAKGAHQHRPPGHTPSNCCYVPAKWADPCTEIFRFAPTIPAARITVRARWGAAQLPMRFPIEFLGSFQGENHINEDHNIPNLQFLKRRNGLMIAAEAMGGQRLFASRSSVTDCLGCSLLSRPETRYSKRSCWARNFLYDKVANRLHRPWGLVCLADDAQIGFPSVYGGDAGVTGAEVIS